MKLKNTNLILSLLLSFNFIQPAFEFSQLSLLAHEANKKTEEVTLYHITTIYSIIAATYLAYNSLETFFLNQSENQISNEYPFAQAWYNEIANKYPSSQLDQRTLLCSPIWMNQNYMALQSKFNNIYCPKETLEIINNIYKNKTIESVKKGVNTKENTTQDDELEIKIAEFLLLRQAYHCKHKSTISFPVSFATSGVIIALAIEGLKHQISIPSFNITNLNGAIAGSLFIHIIEFQELEADIFAYKIATDFNVFNGAFAYFEQDSPKYTIDITPPLYLRINALNNEFTSAAQRICRKN